MLLKIPICRKNSPESVCFFYNGRKVEELQIRLSDDEMDCWEYFLIPGKCRTLEVMEKQGRKGAAGIQFLEDYALMEAIWEKGRPQFHLTPECGRLERIYSLDREKDKWEMVMEYSMMSGENASVYRRCTSRDLLHWDVSKGFLDEDHLTDGNIQVFRQLSGFENWGGKVACVCWYQHAGRFYEAAISSEIHGKNFENLMSLPFERKGERLFPLRETEHLRVWERRWTEVSLEEPFERELRFRIVPGRWPDIRIVRPDYTGEDIDGELFEVKLEIETEEAETIHINLCGRELCWERKEEKLFCGGGFIPAKTEDGNLKLHFWADHGVMEILAEGRVLLEIWEEAPEKEKPQPGIADNIDFKLDKMERHFLKIQDVSGTAFIREATVYGLRGIYLDRDSWTAVKKEEKFWNEPCYNSKSFSITGNRVKDLIYGEPPAYVVEKDTVVSPPRVVEEFQWRENGWGDMSRQICRTASYRLQVPKGRFPELETGLPVLDMAYRLAADVFYLCGSKEYALAGQENMWTAGLFQGKGEGFGVWLRDTTHTAIRCGNLIDREMAHRTLRYAARQGFDNGADGPAMAAVGIWDYYCATGDISLVLEAWPDLQRWIQEAERRYEPEKGLVYAAQSTSNDAFEEPEAGGYCLGSEIYYMDAFFSMEKMGKLIGESVQKTGQWGNIGRKMRKKIRKDYWKEEAGHFTSGPRGTESYEKSYWETSGMEGAVWPRFGIADDRQRRLSLESLKTKAMTEFGIDLFPYRKEKNHFCHASWGVWNAGFAAAACETGDSELLWKLLMQQVRNAIMNKTFYEVIDVTTGRAWRWPGQLWHAAGFVSCIYYGLLGIRYDEKGLVIRPIRQPYLKEITLKGLRFGKGTYDIWVNPRGNRLYLDNQPVECILQNLTGFHRLEYK